MIRSIAIEHSMAIEHPRLRKRVVVARVVSLLVIEYSPTLSEVLEVHQLIEHSQTLELNLSLRSAQELLSILDFISESSHPSSAFKHIEHFPTPSEEHAPNLRSLLSLPSLDISKLNAVSLVRSCHPGPDC